MSPISVTQSFMTTILIDYNLQTAITSKKTLQNYQNTMQGYQSINLTSY